MLGLDPAYGDDSTERDLTKQPSESGRSSEPALTKDAKRSQSENRR